MQESLRQNTATVARESTTAIFVANPTSGTYIHHIHQIEETLAFLRKQGWQIELKYTHAPGDAERIAREAATRKIQVVVAIGGDGTINGIIQGLAGSETALGVLPSGTVNVWAREVGIPLDYTGAREVLLNGQTRYVDLGRVNDRYFLLMVGIGFDGEVTLAVEKKVVKRLGVVGYLLVGTWLSLGFQDFRTALEIDEREIKINALQIIVGNTQLYGGALKYTWQARCDDGMLDICIVRKQSMLGRIFVFSDFLLGREERQQWVRYEKGASIKLRTRKPVAIQVDGEPMGYTAPDAPFTDFSIAPGALKVIVPKNVPPELFAKE